jgi:hypothetical protein
MKTTEAIKELHPTINSMLGEIDAKIIDFTKKCKKELITKIAEEKAILLKKMCEEYDIPYQEAKEKFLSDKEKKVIIDIQEIAETKNEELLDTIEIENKTYFYENKDKGIIFDNKSKPVGIFKGGKFILNP